jgi:hypothetical protein
MSTQHFPTVRYLKLPAPPPRCPDGTYKGCIVYHTQAHTLWYFSWITLGSTAIALANNHYDFALSTLGVCTTSLLYWWDPVPSWRRNCDMTMVQISLWHHLYRAITSGVGANYFALKLAAVAFYPLGVYLHNVGDTWGGVLCHMMVHFIANIGNYVLYTHTAQKFETSTQPPLIAPHIKPQ